MKHFLILIVAYFFWQNSQAQCTEILSISTQNEISKTHNATQAIYLLPGFAAKGTKTTTIRAYIAPCSVRKEIDSTAIASQFVGNLELIAYPNPFSDDITIEYSLAQGEKGQLAVYSILGQLIVTQALDNATTETQQLSLKTETWAAGIYVLSLQQQNGEKKTIKVIKE